MKKNTIIIFIVALIIVGSGYCIYSKQNLSQGDIKECSNIVTADVLKKVGMIDGNKTKYASTSKDILGESTEGGVQINYTSGNELILIEQQFYGETGKSEVTYYLQNGKVFYFTKVNTEYLLPISQDSSGKIKSIETKEFYLGNEEQLCTWYLDKKLQSSDKDTGDLVDYLITGLRD
jgi:hypothetical protein